MIFPPAAVQALGLGCAAFLLSTGGGPQRLSSTLAWNETEELPEQLRLSQDVIGRSPDRALTEHTVSTQLGPNRNHTASQRCSSHVSCESFSQVLFAAGILAMTRKICQTLSPLRRAHQYSKTASSG